MLQGWHVEVYWRKKACVGVRGEQQITLAACSQKEWHEVGIMSNTRSRRNEQEARKELKE
eukprot:1160494-Pelagomonas_calceolata.AAC.10